MRIAKLFAFSVLVSWSVVLPVVGLAAVEEVAPGVFFRTESKGCNNGWIVFQEYVLVIDANFPDVAEEVIRDIKQTTDKPIRFVIDTHHHSDHSFGNGVFAREGAAIVAHRDCAATIQQSQNDFQRWIQSQSAFHDLTLPAPTILFDDELVFDDGTRRVELISFGHGHTAGDAVAYLPHEKILFTGDACVNGAFNYMGDSYVDLWIDNLTEMIELDVEIVCPGYGPKAGRELLKTQRSYFIDLRRQVQEGIDKGKTFDKIAASIEIPEFKAWTGVEPREANIQHVYEQLVGLKTPWQLIELGHAEGQSPTKDTPGWTPPKTMITQGLNQADIASLKRIAPDMEFINVDSPGDIQQHIETADGMMGPFPNQLISRAERLRWVHSVSAGVSGYMTPEFVSHPAVLTNGQGSYGPAIADSVIGYMIMLSKGWGRLYEFKLKNQWRRVRDFPYQELKGKTLLILGLGGIGGQVAKRAAAFDMKIYAIDPQDIEKPRYITRIGKPDEMHAMLPSADYVVCTVPLTKYTDRYFNKTCFNLMKPTSYFINIGRGQVVNQDDLIEALQTQSIAGAGLDVTDPEPLPSDSPLWQMSNVIITPHNSGWSNDSNQRRWLLLRENIRRFAAGEPLLNVVNKQVGY